MGYASCLDGVSLEVPAHGHRSGRGHLRHVEVLRWFKLVSKMVGSKFNVVGKFMCMCMRMRM